MHIYFRQSERVQNTSTVGRRLRKMVGPQKQTTHHRHSWMARQRRHVGHLSAFATFERRPLMHRSTRPRSLFPLSAWN